MTKNTDWLRNWATQPHTTVKTTAWPKSSLLILFHIYHLSMKWYSPGVQPPPSLETTFSKSLDAGVKACTPPSVWAVIIWLGLCHIKPQPAKDSPEEKAERERGREICTTTHLCRAKIGTNQMAPHWMLPSASGHPSETPSQGFFFPSSSQTAATEPQTEKSVFFPQTNPTPAACSNL